MAEPQTDRSRLRAARAVHGFNRTFKQHSSGSRQTQCAGCHTLSRDRERSRGYFQTKRRASGSISGEYQFFEQSHNRRARGFRQRCGN